MSKIYDNIQELRKILNEKPFDKDVALEFLDAISENAATLENHIIDLGIEVRDFKDEINMLESDNNSKDSRISELEDEIELGEGLKIIDCGIGEINYENPNNLVLQDVMDSLETAIKKTNPRKVNEVLEAIN